MFERRSGMIRVAPVLVAILALALTAGAARAAAAQGSAHHTRVHAPIDPTAVPVLLELFSTESCNKCPPADSVLSLLVDTQPVDGARIIAIEPHVNIESPWTDPFAMPACQARQDAYTASFHRNSSYTPQAVVDGSVELPGYNKMRVLHMISHAADQPKPYAVMIEPLEAGGDSLALNITVKSQGPAPTAANPPGPADILVVITEDGLGGTPTSGENAGRPLHHDHVARAFITAGHLDGPPASPVRVTARTALSPAWHRDQLTAVVFVQDTTSRHILGVNAYDLK